MTVLDEIEPLAEELWRIDPDDFAQHVSDGKWTAWPHLSYVARRIADAVVRGNGRLIINMPPGHGKSELISHWVPTWILENRPAQRVILTSHGAELAGHWGRIVRNEFEVNERLTTRLTPDSKAADRWNTPQGGGMKTDGVGGGITGFRANLVLVDDPHPTWEAAMSSTHRLRVREWFDGTLYDRCEPNATIVLLMHRWHDEDLTGYLIEKHSDPWEVISLPALAETGDLLGRESGEALCPQRYSADALRVTELAVGRLVYAAKYQQRPTGLGTTRVYDRFDPAVHEDKTLTLRDDLPLDVSFDFNRNPGMHVEIGQYDQRRDLFTAVHEIHGPLMKLDASLAALDKLLGELGHWRWPRMRIFGDATGTQERAETTDTAYQQIVNWISRKPWKFQFNVPRSNPPVGERIDTFNEALRDSAGEVHFKLHPVNCPRLLADLKTLKPDEQGLIDKRDLKLSHASDAEGYRIYQLRPVRRMVNGGGQVLFSR
jgi:hypothetical protein